MTHDQRFEDLAHLLLPAGGRVAHAGRDWQRRPAGQDAPLVWGRLATPSGRSTFELIRTVLRRTRAEREVRRASGLVLRERHELRPGRLGGSSARGRVRSWVLAGRALELRPRGDVRPHRLDVALEQHGSAIRSGPLHASSAGGVTVSVTPSAGGEPAIARAGRARAPADPSGEITALTRLGDLPLVSGLVGHGSHDGLTWCIQSALSGAPPNPLTPGLAEQAGDFLRSLPDGDAPPTAHRHDAATLRRSLPQHGDAIQRVVEYLDTAGATLPATTRHGDFWRGNLLATDDRLTGVVDWDAWSPTAIPATDLVQLLLTERRHDRQVGLATLWRERAWEHPDVAEPLRRHLRAVGAPVDASTTAVIAAAWWLAEVAGTIHRRPQLAHDPTWLTTNVEPVLADLAQA